MNVSVCVCVCPAAEHADCAAQGERAARLNYRSSALLFAQAARAAPPLP